MAPYADPRDRYEYERRRSKGQGRRRAQTKRRRTLPPRFVALDGEGLSVPDGERQPYVLFAANNGEFVENYEGLSTRVCFDFLLAQQHADKNARLVVFGGGYDMTQMLVDLPRDSAQRLAETGETEYQYALNAWYFIRFFPGKLLTIQRIIEHPTQPKRMRHRVTLFDVFGYFQASFVKTISDWNIGTPEIRAEIAAMKDKRHSFASADREEVRAYCLQECELLRELMDAVGEAIFRVDSMPMSHQWHGSGALADSLLQDRYMLDALEGPEPPAEVERAYYGGRIETTRAGVISPPLYEYDIRSAYPSALARLPSMRGEWHEAVAYEPDADHAVWTVAWDVRRTGVGQFLGPFPVRHGGGLWWPTTGAGAYLAVEVAAAVAVFGDAVQVFGGHVFEPTYPRGRPWAWLAALYEERARLRERDLASGGRRNVVLKLALNAVYGKTAQRGNWKLDRQGEPELAYGRWRHLYAAGWQTASTRAALLRACAQNPGAVVSLATDSVTSTAPLDLPLGTSLGQWEEIEHTQAMVLVQPGFAVPDGEGSYKRRVRGGLHSSVGFEAFRSAWERDGLAGVVPSPDQRFIGLRLAAGLGDVTKRGAWVSRDRMISFEPDRRTPGDIRGEYQLLDPPAFPFGGEPGQESAAVETPSGREALLRWGMMDARNGARV